MKKLAYGLILIGYSLFISISANALPIDEYERTLPDHEAQGGHTIQKHVGKSLAWLRNRCKTDSSLKGGHATSYINLDRAEEIIAEMIKKNKAKVDIFINSSKKKKVIKAPWKWPTWYEFGGGYGYGINCRRAGQAIRLGRVRLPRDIIFGTETVN